MSLYLPYSEIDTETENFELLFKHHPSSLEQTK